MRRRKSAVATGMGLAFLFGICAQGFAATLAWDPSPGEVSGYKIHYGTTSGKYTNHVNVGNQTHYSLDKLPLTESALYYFTVSAYNGAGESGYSTPVKYRVPDATPPTPPSGLTVE